MHRRTLLRSGIRHTRVYASGVTTLPENLPSTLDELIEVLSGLSELAPVERARMFRALDNRARAILGDGGDEAIYEATRVASQAEVARLLGVTPSRINNAITSYHRRRGDVSLTRGRPRKG